MNYESTTPGGAQERLAQLSSTVRLAMNRIRGYVIGLAVVSLMLSACVEDQSVEPGAPALIGFVTDSAGSALRDVGVHYIFYTKYNSENWGVIYAFEFPSYRDEPATVDIVNPLGVVIEKLLDGDTVSSGTNWVEYNTRVTNGIYSCKITTPDTLITYRFNRRIENLDSLAIVAPLVSTNSGGRFYLTMSVLGIGAQIVDNFVDEFVHDSITIVLYKNGYQPYAETFRVDTTKEMMRQFMMARD